ncbi:MAG: TonB family protein [Prevotella sp.]
MGAFFIYNIKVSLCLIAFFLVYKLLISRDTFYRFSHYLLLGLVAVSLVLPVVRLSLNDSNALSEGVVDMEAFVMQVAASQSPASADLSLSPWQVVCAIYIIGVIVLAIMNVVSFIQISRLMAGGEEAVRHGGLRVVVVDEPVSPFSWFGNVVMNRTDYATAPHEILTHEQAHARLGHSYEVLLCNLLILFQWFNPAAWLLKRELQDIHEYEADAAVLREGVNAKQYQMLLIMKSVGERAFLLANNLNHNSLKKRIRMMNRKKTERWKCLKALAIVPVAVCAAVAFASPVAEQATRTIERETSIVTERMAGSLATETPAVLSAATVEEQKNVSDAVPEPAAHDGDDDKVYDLVDNTPEFPGGSMALMEFLRDNVKYPKGAFERNVQGSVIVSFVIDRDGSVTDVHALKPLDEELDAEAVRVISSMPKWTPGTVKGEPVRVKYFVPVAFRLKTDKPTDKAGAAGSTGKKPLLSASDMLYVVDGEVRPQAEATALEPSAVKSVEVLKTDEALKQYGAEGKKGIVVIKTK